MKYLIKLSYDGSKFYGFQRLKNKPTIQGELEKALELFTHEKVMVKGASRTDRGVHAYMQAAHFELQKEISCVKIKTELERKTSQYIHLISCQKVAPHFQARFQVKRKIYLYRIKIGPHDPFLADYCYQSDSKIEIKKLKKVARILKGAHNFKNFVSGTRNNYDCIIEKIIIKASKNEIEIYFYGVSFYHYMVRNLVGAMLDYERGIVDLTFIQKMLRYPEEDRQLTTAPPEGLYLVRIEY